MSACCAFPSDRTAKLAETIHWKCPVCGREFYVSQDFRGMVTLSPIDPEAVNLEAAKKAQEFSL